MAQENDNENLSGFQWNSFPGMENGEGISAEDFATEGGTDPKPLEATVPPEGGEEGQGGGSETTTTKKPVKKTMPRITNDDFSDEGSGGDDDEQEDEGQEEGGNNLPPAEEGGEGATGLIKLATFLKDKGVLSNAVLDGKEDITEEELVEMHEEEYASRFNNYTKEFFEGLKSQDEAVALFEHLKNGGKVADFVQVYGKTGFAEDMDLTKPENQKAIMRRHLIEIEGAEPDEAETELDQMEEAGLLEAKSKRAFNKFLVTDKKAKEDLLAKNKQKEADGRENAKKFSENITTFLDKADKLKSIPVTTKEKTELKDYLTKPAVVNGASKVPQFNADLAAALRDPEKLAAIAHLLKNDFNVTTKAKTEVTKQVKSSLSGIGLGSTGSTKRRTGNFVEGFPGMAK